MAKEDRDATRFLWPKDPFAAELLLRVMRWTRTAFGFTSSPFHLIACLHFLADLFAAIMPVASRALKEGTFMDDLTSGANSIEEGLQLAKDTVTITQDAKLKLHRFTTNSKSLQEKFVEFGFAEAAESDQSAATKRPNKVLGSTWNLEEDVIGLDVSQLVEHIERTKDLQTLRKLL